MKIPFMKKSSPAQWSGSTSPDLSSRFVRFARQLLESFEIDSFLTATIDLIIDLAKAERGLIILFDQEGTPLYEAARDASRQNLEYPEFQVSHKIIEQTRAGKQALYLRNAMQDSTFRNSASIVRLKILSVICLPLQVEQQVIGVVYLDNRTIMGAFEEETYKTVCEFADFISVAAFRALERKQLKNHVHALEKELRLRYRFDAIVGHHPRMVEVLKTLSQVANTDVTVLVRGESGTGKELIARALHYNHQRRCQKLFIPVNCGAIPESLLESELFGHVKGAFTGAFQDKQGWFERAQGGTIFLDEINELALPLQVKLLRILQTGEYSRIGSPEIRFCDVRIVAATSKNLQELVEKHVFREDLYYRLNVIELILPPLRQRASDILLLAGHFLKMYGEKFGKPQCKLSAAAEQVLTSYQFPGNVRELENVIQRAIVLTSDEIIDPLHFPPVVLENRTIPLPSSPWLTFRDSKKKFLQNFEKEYVEKCLAKAHGNISNAASLSDMNIKNFYTKMRQHKLDPSKWKSR
jgi:Nif-specific regulatory protein